MMEKDQSKVKESKKIEEIIKKYRQSSNPNSKEYLIALEETYKLILEKAPKAKPALEDLVDFSGPVGLDIGILKGIRDYIKDCIDPTKSDYENRIENLIKGLELLSTYTVHDQMLLDIYLYMLTSEVDGEMEVPNPSLKEVLDNIMNKYLNSDQKPTKEDMWYKRKDAADRAVLSFVKYILSNSEGLFEKIETKNYNSIFSESLCGDEAKY